ncbi:CDP-alcohol phosphatidyltransferase family protein [Actinomadura rudentiformis]|uniref:CDP-alcohol phosphatidyltransferase family protein n=1 Tax=Actinomadura rudentiformis TaxID=359158 RepID=A0A6H9Z1S2_9ACTN|nr:CDP-alcohol phosphatidyltransferase family protein [Actinomadura rudentiformis]KAB2351755.1 CDP-alcohol phosphatidyltransferase family protein [Actinomadura rudentiformis]
MATYSLEDVRAVCKQRDAWWTVLLVDPIAVRLAWLVANRTPFTPNQITLAAFALGLGSAGCFAQATAGWLALGALLYHLGFVLDCVDGKIARLRGTGSPFGAWLDFMLDRVRDGLCALALAGGQYAATGQVAYLWLGFAVLALDMIRYLNGPQIAKARRKMVTRPESEQPGRPEAAGRSDRTPAAPSWYLRVRRSLLRCRIRMHLVSGIEFQMATFIVGPLTGAIIPVTAVAGLLLVAFECLIIYRFWKSTRGFTRTFAERPTFAPPAEMKR